MIHITDSTTSRETITEYLWDFGDGTTSTSFTPPPHYYSQPGNYPVRLIVATETGCTDTVQMKVPVKVVQSPVISISADSVICLNDYVRFEGINIPDTSAIQWAWKFPNGNTDNRVIPVLQQFKTAGSFQATAIATNSSGCADTASQNLVVHALPTVELPATLIRQAGFPVKLPALYSTGVDKYRWSPVTGLDCIDCPQPEASPKFNTKYAVNFTDQNGCSNDAEIQIVVLCENANVFVPNTFSPNGDGNNDVFYVRGKGLDRVKTIRIYNRWGEIVFEKKDFTPNDASAGWNGQYRGSRAQTGVYIYQVEVFCENGDVIKHQGNIALIH
jgi:gliding motility-associated-like protein